MVASAGNSRLEPSSDAFRREVDAGKEWEEIWLQAGRKFLLLKQSIENGAETDLGLRVSLN